MKRQRFTIDLKQDKTSKWFVASVKEVPGAVSQGKTIYSTLRNINDALITVLQVRSKQK